MAEVEALSERSRDCWRELQVPLGITSKRGLLAVPCSALEADQPAEGNPPARREAGAWPLGRPTRRRDPAVRHVRRRRPWREATGAAGTTPLCRTTVTGAAWRRPSSAAGGASGSRWARRQRRREPPETRRMRGPAPWRGCR